MCIGNLRERFLVRFRQRGNKQNLGMPDLPPSIHICPTCTHTRAHTRTHTHTHTHTHTQHINNHTRTQQYPQLEYIYSRSDSEKKPAARPQRGRQRVPEAPLSLPSAPSSTPSSPITISFALTP